MLISGGGGYGISAPPCLTNVVTANHRTRQHVRSDGWLARACWWTPVWRPWVVGAFADATYSDINGDHAWRVLGSGEPLSAVKADWSGTGARIGYRGPVVPEHATPLHPSALRSLHLQRIVPPFQAGLQVPADVYGFSSQRFRIAPASPGFRETEAACRYDRKDRVSPGIAGFACAALARPVRQLDSRTDRYTAKTEGVPLQLGALRLRKY